MFIIVVIAVCSVLHAAYEYVSTWTLKIQTTALRFATRNKGNWDGNMEAEAYARVNVSGYGMVIDTPRACDDCSPGTWYSLRSPNSWQQSGVTLAQASSVVVQMWDVDDNANDFMGGSTIDVSHYKSLGSTTTVNLSMSGEFTSTSYIRVVVGLWPYKMTECSSRMPKSDGTGCYSNGDPYTGYGGCYQQLSSDGQGGHNSTCSTACPTGISDPGNGMCVLKPNCRDRQANTLFSHPCGGGCFRLMNDAHTGYLSGGGSCNNTCPVGFSTQNGNCVPDADCSKRQVSASAQYPCSTRTCYQQLDPTGNGTYLNSGPGSCGTTCPYEISDTNNNGKCVLIPRCSDRQANKAHRFPCGTSDCFQQLDGDLKLQKTCNVSCHSSLSDGDNTKGTCVLRDCAFRVSDSTLEYPCGSSDCFQQLDYSGDGTLHTTCDVGCPSRLSDKDNTTGTCVLKDCALRVSDSSHAYPCGTSDCFQQLDYSGNGTLHTTCDVNCPSRLSDKDNTTGTCVLKDCAFRVSDSSHAYPCGTSDCFQQLGSTCDVSCPSNISHEDNTTGTCVMMDCALRFFFFDSPFAYPCWTSDCFQQLDSTCNVSCPSNISYGDNTTSGRCVLKDCALRVFDSSQTYPCGTYDCFQQTNEEGAKTDKCGSESKSPTSKSRQKTTIIIVAVVVSVVVVLAVVVIIILVIVLRRKKRQAYLLADWDCQRGSEIKNYSVRDNIGTSQNNKLYEFINSGKIYTAKCVCPEDGVRGDLSWAEDFSEKIDSKFLVKYFETIRGKKGEYYLVMEHFEHENLQALLISLKKVTKDALLTPDRIMKILIQVLFGLEVLHRHGVTHCDLSTETIFIDENDDAKIGAFGCARREKTHSKDQEMQNLGYVCSSNRSPEVLAGGRCTFYTDMWCLGMVCYKLCRFPNDIDDGNQMVRQLKAPDALIEIIDSLLNQNPDERPSASTLLQHPFIREYSKQLHLVEF